MRMLQMLPLLGWVLIPGCTSSVTSSPEQSGFFGLSLSVICRYNKGYENYKKYWCRGATWRSCETVVQTTGSEAEVKNGRISIKDRHSHSEFTVRLDNLTQQDAGIYWCAIERVGKDLKSHVLISVLPVPILHPGKGSTTTEQVPSVNIPYTDSRLLVPFLISISLKTPIFLYMVFAIIWMRRRRRQHSGEEAPP